MIRAIKAVRAELAELPMAVLANFPGRTGALARAAYWKRRLGRMGRNCRFGCNVRIRNPKFVELGDDCWIDDNVSILAGPPPGGRKSVEIAPYNADVTPGRLVLTGQVHIAANVVLQAHGGIRVERGVTVAAGGKVYSYSHHYRNPRDEGDRNLYYFGSMVSLDEQLMIVGPVFIGEGAAVGLNSVVLPGTRLNAHAWLGSGSVLRGEAPAGAILQGNPAVVVKMRPEFGSACPESLAKVTGPHS